MAKTQKRTAAQRREQAREQTKVNQQRSRRSARKQNKRTTWLIIGSVTLVIGLLIGYFVYDANQQNARVQNGKANAQKTITSIDPALFSTVGKGSITAEKAPKAITDTPLTKDGKTTFLYVGGEYCPNCAVQRWPVIIALSRFGTFGNLNPLNSSEANVSTFTFHNSASYQSEFVNLESVEIQDNNKQELDKLTKQQEEIVTKYNNGGGIPFINIGNRYIVNGASLNYDLLVGKSYEEISTAITDTNSDISRSILGTANYITAAICDATGNKPADVCTSDPVVDIQKELKNPPPATTSVPTNSNSLALNTNKDIALRRQD